MRPAESPSAQSATIIILTAMLLFQSQPNIRYHQRPSTSLGSSNGKFYLPRLLRPSPSFLTTFLGSTSTFVLNNSLSSGLITLGLGTS